MQGQTAKGPTSTMDRAAYVYLFFFFTLCRIFMYMFCSSLCTLLSINKPVQVSLKETHTHITVVCEATTWMFVPGGFLYMGGIPKNWLGYKQKSIKMDVFLEVPPSIFGHLHI